MFLSVWMSVSSPRFVWSVFWKITGIDWNVCNQTAQLYLHAPVHLWPHEKFKFCKWYTCTHNIPDSIVKENYVNEFDHMQSNVINAIECDHEILIDSHNVRRWAALDALLPKNPVFLRNLIGILSVLWPIWSLSDCTMRKTVDYYHVSSNLKYSKRFEIWNIANDLDYCQNGCTWVTYCRDVGIKCARSFCRV